MLSGRMILIDQASCIAERVFDPPSNRGTTEDSPNLRSAGSSRQCYCRAPKWYVDQQAPPTIRIWQIHYPPRQQEHQFGVAIAIAINEVVLWSCP